MKAYAFTNGEINFGDSIPQGALPVGEGGYEGLSTAIRSLARRGYEGELLVPGVPEAEDGMQAVRSVVKFRALVEELMSVLP